MNWTLFRLNRVLARLGLYSCMVLALTGCESISFYAQAIRGHSQIIFNQQKIDDLISAQAISPDARRKLIMSKEVLAFARQSLKLPQGDSYTHYVDTGRPYVVWNVVATPRYSVEPIEHCFLVAGCVSYRGYYALEDARRYAGQLKDKGYDTVIGGVDAYSTLGWFDDPLLNTMLKRDDEELAETLIHELTHQQVYVKDDTSFNESFATAVAQMGMKAWLLDKGELERWQRLQRQRQQREQIITLILEHRERIAAAYSEADAQAQSEAQRSALKQNLFLQLKAAYQALRESGNTVTQFDNWFDSEMNNASLVLFNDYNRWVGAFIRLRAEAPNWPDFYSQVEQLAKLDSLSREAKLSQLEQITQ